MNTNKKVRFTQESIERKQKPKFDLFTKPQNEREQLQKDILTLLDKTEKSVKKLTKKL